MIVDEYHILSGAQNAINAMKGDYMISRSLDVELVVYASAQHQIGRALELMGVVDDLSSVGVVCIDENEKKIRDCLDEIVKKVGDDVSPMFVPTVEKIDALKEKFGITELEMNQFTDSTELGERNRALSKCIVSRVSQVSLDS
jgi:tRNA threonylcarbamoyladenosine modification (KEOPS) complex Cgi121 subunit